MRAAPGEAWEYFLAHLHDDDGDECRDWPFYKSGGYGKVTVEGVKPQLRVARLTCEAIHGAPPSPDHVVRHLCGPNTEWCWNPRHLQWGTQAENLADMERWGTRARGDSHGRSKLTDQQRQEIVVLHREGAPLRALAEAYDVSRSTILRTIERTYALEGGDASR